MWRFQKFYDGHRDAIGIAGIFAAILGAIALIIFLAIITSGWAILWIIVIGAAVAICAALWVIAATIWEDFFE